MLLIIAESAKCDKPQRLQTGICPFTNWSSDLRYTEVITEQPKGIKNV